MARDRRVEAHRDDPENLALILPEADAPVAPTHWSFGQLASLVSAPAAYLRQLPAPLAGINLQYGLTSHRAEQIKTLETEDGRTELRAVTGPDYGRIYDHELVAAVQKIAGNGTGDTRWKVPGTLDWSSGIYNPMVDITKDTTTLYASDRDVFLFLVDDMNPIEAGKLPDGSPDLYFRGFYCWNSEVGAKTLGIASFYLRAVCQNRNLWGVEDFQEISIRHSKYAANRFAHEAAPALTRFADSSPRPFVEGIRAARERIVARNDDDRTDFLRRRGFSKAETARIVETVLAGNAAVDDGAHLPVGDRACCLDVARDIGGHCLVPRATGRHGLRATSLFLKSRAVFTPRPLLAADKLLARHAWPRAAASSSRRSATAPPRTRRPSATAASPSRPSRRASCRSARQRTTCTGCRSG